MPAKSFLALPATMLANSPMASAKSSSSGVSSAPANIEATLQATTRGKLSTMAPVASPDRPITPDTSAERSSAVRIWGVPMVTSVRTIVEKTFLMATMNGLMKRTSTTASASVLLAAIQPLRRRFGRPGAVQGIHRSHSQPPVVGGAGRARAHQRPRMGYPQPRLRQHEAQTAGQAPA